MALRRRRLDTLIITESLPTHTSNDASCERLVIVVVKDAVKSSSVMPAERKQKTNQRAGDALRITHLPLKTTTLTIVNCHKVKVGIDCARLGGITQRLHHVLEHVHHTAATKSRIKINM